MAWLAFLFAIELGLAEQMVGIGPETEELTEYTTGWCGYTELEAGATLFDLLEVGGSAQVFFVPYAVTEYVPFDTRYGFWARVRWGQFEAGWRHECWHPNLALGPRKTGYLYGDSDCFYVKAEMQASPWR